MTTSFYAIAAGTGYVLTNGTPWASVRGAVTGSPSVSIGIASAQGTNSDGKYHITRAFYPINTVTLPANIKVKSAVFHFKAANILAASQTIHLVKTTQGSSTTLVAGDFDNIDFTSGGSVGITQGEGNGVSKTITLNATALGWINGGVVTYLGMIMSRDQSNSDPGGAGYEDCQLSSAADTYLEITYDILGGSVLFGFV